MSLPLLSLPSNGSPTSNTIDASETGVSDLPSPSCFVLVDVVSRVDALAGSYLPPPPMGSSVGGLPFTKGTATSSATAFTGKGPLIIISPNLVRFGVECKATMLRKKFSVLEKRNQPSKMLSRISVFLFKQFLCIRMALHTYLFMLMVVPKFKLTV
ncbi:hypothetical protein SUGI_0081460 [Cryptomeria japonica]|nr:hypothetical protein SUGI_0081460 [Cryptomeria japonica]